jgi:hypothetical protein
LDRICAGKAGWYLAVGWGLLSTSCRETAGHDKECHNSAKNLSRQPRLLGFVSKRKEILEISVISSIIRVKKDYYELFKASYGVFTTIGTDIACSA